jgi:hypothetical protein
MKVLLPRPHAVHAAMRIAELMGKKKPGQNPPYSLFPRPWHLANQGEQKCLQTKVRSPFLDKDWQSAHNKMEFVLKQILTEQFQDQPLKALKAIIQQIEATQHETNYAVYKTPAFYSLTLYEDPQNSEFIKLNYFPSQIAEVNIHEHINEARSYILNQGIIQSIVEECETLPHFFHKDTLLIHSASVGAPKKKQALAFNETGSLIPKAKNFAPTGKSYIVPAKQPHSVLAFPDTITLFHIYPRENPNEPGKQNSYRKLLPQNLSTNKASQLPDLSFEELFQELQEIAKNKL